GILGGTGQIENGRREIDVAHEPGEPAGTRAWYVNDEGHSNDFVPHFTAVKVGAVLAERLAVVTGQDDDGAIGQGRCGKRAQDATDVVVGERDLAIVEVARRMPERAEARMLEVLLVRVEEMGPDEEGPGRDGGIGEQLDHGVGEPARRM